MNSRRALSRFVDDGDVPISNNWVENQIRPIALGRANWLFAGSLRAGKRGAAVKSLLHSARINGHDPYAYFKDVLERLPTHPAGRIDDLLPIAGVQRSNSADTAHRKSMRLGRTFTVHFVSLAFGLTQLRGLVTSRPFVA
mgnify:FL=1